jgi:DNA replication protein DnaC
MEKDESPYKCSICEDGHFVHPRRVDGTVDYSSIVDCPCIQEERALKRRHALIAWCELPKKTEKLTFDNFRVSPKLKEAYDAARDMAMGDATHTFLTLMGPSDRGKTHLLVAICRHWLAQGRIARYAFVPILLDELRSGFREGGDGSYEERWQRFLNVPLLALDDLGTENPTPWVQERLDTLIDYRLVNGLFTVITTNLLLEEMPPRISSRLNRDGLIINVVAPAYSTNRGDRGLRSK